MKRIDVKKLAAFTLALCMCAAMAGCGSSAKTEEEQVEEKLESITEEEIDEAAKKLEEAEGGETTTTTEEAEPEEFDPFEYLEISYTGIAPYAKVNLSEKSGIPSEVNFTAVDAYAVGIGDTITISAELQMKSDDYVLTKDTNTYTVDGLSEYLMTLDELSGEVDEKLKKQADDLLTSAVSEFGEYVHLKDTEFMGNYLLTVKTGGTFGEGNRLFYIYNISVTQETSGDDGDIDIDYIWYAYIDDVYKLGDGKWVIDTSSMNGCMDDFESEKEIPGGWGQWYYGYPDLDSFFSNQIATDIDRSNYETNIK